MKFIVFVYFFDDVVIFLEFVVDVELWDCWLVGEFFDVFVYFCVGEYVKGCVFG